MYWQIIAISRMKIGGTLEPTIKTKALYSANRMGAFIARIASERELRNSS